MQIIKPMQQGIVLRTFPKNGKFYLSLASLSYFPFHNPIALGLEQDMWDVVTASLYPEMIFDIGLPKSRAEVLMLGECHTPDETFAKRCFVDLDCGPIQKRIVVTGNRYWQKRRGEEGIMGFLKEAVNDWRPSDPEPFLKMDIGWRNAFGGVGFEDNPLGKGFLPKGTSPDGDGMVYLPNVESSDRMTVSMHMHAPRAAGYGPIDALWPERKNKAGKKYNKKWEKELFPEPAEDMDPTYYNVAPGDQQLTTPFWNGDEKIRITNMHPERSEIQTALPAIRPRCFVLQRDSKESIERWTEVKLNPETVWLLPNLERGILFSRGTFQIDTFYGIDVDTVLLAWELRDGKARTSEDYRNSVRLRQDEETAADWSAREDDLSPPEGVPEEPPFFKADDDEVNTDERFQAVLDKGTKSANGMLGKAREILANAGLNPDDYLDATPIVAPALPASPVFEKMSDLPGVFAYADMEYAKLDADFEKMKAESKFYAETKEEARQKIEDKAREICDSLGEDYDQLVAEKKAEPPSTKSSTEKIAEVIKDAKSKLAGHPDKLAQLDGALAALAATQPQMDAIANDPDIKAMERESAHYNEPLPPLSDDTKIELQEMALARYKAGEGFEGVDLSGADFSGLCLAGANFKGAILIGTIFTKCDLTEADFTEATLARADFTGANLTGAVLDKAGLGKTFFRSSDLTGANLNEVTLDQTDFNESTMKGVALSTGLCMQSSFINADMSEAILRKLDAIESDFSNAKFIGSELSNSSFVTCNMEHCDFSGAVLEEASFVETNATDSIFFEAKMNNANAHLDSVFENAVFDKIEGEGINFASTKLDRSSFVEATLTEADFNESGLREAVFDKSIARDANFTDSDCTKASFIGTDLMNSSFQGARLQETKFSRGHLFGADFLYAQLENVDLKQTVIKRSSLED